MRLKNYQEKALDWLRRYYESCRALQETGDPFPVATAFTSITAEIYGSGLSYSIGCANRSPGSLMSLP